MRELLIVLEENLQFSDNLEYPDLTFTEITKLMSDYSNADIAYSTIMAQEAELIKAHIIDAGNFVFNECIYFSLTYKGHKFLENVKTIKFGRKLKILLEKSEVYL